jgi:putative hydrolase of the HAD superfamily
VLVCDLGKVLLPFDTEPCWRAIIAQCDLGDDARSAFREVYAECAIGLGRTEPEEFHRRLVARIGLGMDYDTFCHAWSDMFWEDEAVLELVRAARVERRILLSNTNAIHWSWIRSHYPHVLDPFDRWVLSHECGLEKPDAAIFRLVEQETGHPSGAHLFIDDIRDNVEGARAAGWDAVLHTDAAALRIALASRGVF